MTLRSSVLEFSPSISDVGFYKIFVDLIDTNKNPMKSQYSFVL